MATFTRCFQECIFFRTSNHQCLYVIRTSRDNDERYIGSRVYAAWKFFERCADTFLRVGKLNREHFAQAWEIRDKPTVWDYKGNSWATVGHIGTVIFFAGESICVVIVKEQRNFDLNSPERIVLQSFSSFRILMHKKNNFNYRYHNFVPVTGIHPFSITGHIFQTPEVVNIILEPGIWWVIGIFLFILFGTASRIDLCC